MKTITNFIKLCQRVHNSTEFRLATYAPYPLAPAFQMMHPRHLIDCDQVVVVTRYSGELYAIFSVTGNVMREVDDQGNWGPMPSDTKNTICLWHEDEGFQNHEYYRKAWTIANTYIVMLQLFSLNNQKGVEWLDHEPSRIMLPYADDVLRICRRFLYADHNVSIDLALDDLSWALHALYWVCGYFWGVDGPAVTINTLLAEVGQYSFRTSRQEDAVSTIWHTMTHIMGNLILRHGCYNLPKSPQETALDLMLEAIPAQWRQYQFLAGFLMKFSEYALAEIELKTILSRNWSDRVSNHLS